MELVYVLHHKYGNLGSDDIVVGNTKSRQGLYVGRKDGSEKNIVRQLTDKTIQFQSFFLPSFST